MSLDEWLKPTVEDINGLLGSLSAEDMKWVDLEFLDLASGPPATQDRGRNKNNAQGSSNYNNFPDIFFGDFSAFDDLRPFADLQLDLLPPATLNEPESSAGGTGGTGGGNKKTIEDDDEGTVFSLQLESKIFLAIFMANKRRNFSRDLQQFKRCP